MTNRREFLLIGFAASAWPIASHAARAAALSGGARFAPTEHVELYKVVYDSRFEHSVAFGRRAQALGVDAHAIEGDMTRFWYDDVYHRWKRSPVAIAGLTAHGPLFCFERLGWDQGLRVVFRAEHKPSARGWREHLLSGPASMLDVARGAVATGDWSAAMAAIVTQCPAGRTEIAATAASVREPFGARSSSESLYSWVIAPAVRA